MIYEQLLKADFEKLPPALREFHSGAGRKRAAGKVAVRHASGLAVLIGFPPSGDDIPMRLDVEREVAADGNREIWNRGFGSVVRRSVQWIKDDLLVEAAGPLRLYFRVFAGERGMRFQSERARFWGIPLPLRVEGTARGAGASWEFEVTISHVGSYRGIMEPVP